MPNDPASPPETTVPVNRAGEPDWMERHLRAKERARAGGIDLLFLGDSITQAMADVQDLLESSFQTKSVAPFGSSGDRTQHLLWRIENGELDGLTPKLVAVLIGTNNIEHWGESDDDLDIAAGITACIRALQKRFPRSRILIIGILPRGQYADDRLRPHIRYVNRLTRQLADGDRIFFTDVEDSLYADYASITAEIMPDFVHLSRAGFTKLFAALSPTIGNIMKRGLRRRSFWEFLLHIFGRWR